MDCFGTYFTHVQTYNVTRVQSATPWTASVHLLHMSTASVHTLHMSKPNVTHVQSAMEWTASVHILHMSTPNVTRVQSATEWTASVHTLHMSKPNVTRVQSAMEWTASVHILHMSKPVITFVFIVLRPKRVSKGMLKKVRHELVSSNMDFRKMANCPRFYIKMSVLLTGASWRADQLVANYSYGTVVTSC